MPVGQTWAVEAAVETEPSTGTVVERLTDDIGHTYYPYFTQPVVSSDGRLVLLSSDRAGKWQCFIRDIPARRIVQVTDAPAGVNHHTSCLDPERGLMYYWSERTLHRVAVDGTGDEALYAIPPGHHPSILSISRGGRYLAFAYVEDRPVSTETGVIYSSMLERLYQRPRSVLVRIDLDERRALAVYGECEWYSHVSISPTDPDLILFCHEGPWELVQRMWVARVSTHEVWPLVEQRRHLERTGHEYFTDRGRVLTQYAVRERATDAEWRHANILVNPDGSDARRYWYEGVNPAHVQTSHGDDLRMVADCGPRRSWGDAEGGSWIALLHLDGERSTLTPLCRHATSWKTQMGHPHPAFWPDDGSVIFNSDRGGRCNVYRAAMR